MTHLSGYDRSQILLLPEVVDDYVGADNPVRFIDAFVDGLDLATASFSRVEPKMTGRPGYAPADLLKLYIYGYLNRVRSSRRLEAETHRNIEVIWLLRHLKPDFKTIADFRRDNVELRLRRAMRLVDVVPPDFILGLARAVRLVQVLATDVNAGSEKHFYLNDAVHGTALAELPITNGGQDLLKVLTDASKSADGFQSLSAVKAGYFPLILTASRHYRLPVPHPFWISLLVPLNPND